MALFFVSNLTPPIPLRVSGEQSDNSLFGSLLSLAQPGIEGQLPVVGEVTVEPYGAPVEGLGTIVFLAALGLMAFGTYSLVRRLHL